MKGPRIGRRAAESGFTLLEAIVAMVLVCSVGLALFAWINGNIFALNRITEVNAESEATVNVLEFMHTVNPMLAPRGQTELGGYRVSWESQPNVVIDKLEGYYQYGLYDNRVAVAHSDGRPWFELNLQQVGFRKVRSGAEGG